LKELEESLHARGLRLQRHMGRVQLTSAPEMAELVERFLGLEAVSHLSRAALETLAIIAYQQPVTRPQVDALRGVNSDGMMKSLLSKGLVQEAGRTDGPGRPILYSTTPEFLQHFGINSIMELPPLTPPEGEAEKNVELLKG
jgi:segregation and condensation protein B